MDAELVAIPEFDMLRAAETADLHERSKNSGGGATAEPANYRKDGPRLRAAASDVVFSGQGPKCSQRANVVRSTPETGRTLHRGERQPRAQEPTSRGGKAGCVGLSCRPWSRA